MNNLRFVGLSAIRRYTMLLLLWAMAAMAWAQDCSFSISHTMTPGVCTADGAIKVDIINTTAPTSTQFQYLLFNITAGGDPTTIRTTERSYTFTNLVPGRYRVEVIAQCAGGSASSQSINDINVTTTYVPMIGGHNQDLSRDAYACGTGRIVVSLSKGKGTYTIRIANGPMRVGETIPYTVVSTGEYQLDYEDWKPGTYRIAVTDECNNVFAFDVVVGEITEIPNVRGSYLGVSSQDCRTLKMLSGFQLKIEGHRKTLQAGLYEIGYAFRGQSDADIVWHTLSNSSTLSIVAPKSLYELSQEVAGTYRNLGATDSERRGYYTDKLTLITRLKPCPSVRTQQKIDVHYYDYFHVDLLNLENCRPSLRVQMHNKAIYCAPITYELRVEINGLNVLVGNFVSQTPSEWSPQFPIPDNVPMPKQGETLKIHLKATDANGLVWMQTSSVTETFPLSFSTEKACSPTYGVKTTRYLFNKELNLNREFLCGLTVRLYNSSSQLIGEYPAPAAINGLEWGKRYYLHYMQGNQKLKEVIVERENASINNVLRATGERSQHALNYGSIYVTVGGVSGDNSYLTITGPEGYSYRRTILVGSSGGGTTGFKSPESHLPKGIYTVKFYNSCNGKTVTTTYDHPGFYQVEDFDYDITYGCGLAHIRPRAKVKLGNRFLGDNEYAFFIHPKNQAVQNVVAREGETITLSKEGEYTISLVIHRSTSNWTYQSYLNYLNKSDYEDYRLVDIPIIYKTPSLNIDSTRTLAYACANNVLGDIYIQAHGGIGPYTYQLFLDPDYQQPARYTDGREVKETGASAVYFKYGQMGQTYYVRYTDACGSLQKYKIRMLNVNDLQLAYAVPSRVCSGGTVNLRMAGPEVFRNQATALWRDPQGRTINSSDGSVDREIVNVTAAKAGMYSVVFTLPGCGTPVTNQVKVEVTNAVNGTIPSTTEYTVCVGKSIAIQGATTTEPKASISWQYARTRTLNPDFLTGTSDEEYIYRWEEHPALENATQSTLNMSFDKPGLYALRNFISYGCELVSPPILVRVRYCYVPLNPHLMHRPSVDWSGVFLSPLLN
ncbi:MAG: hypothetical protein Q4A44_01645 [Bacteroidales bacterium]|nr:hypothetical protein [Bacteroidales bacterium]